MNAKYDLNYYKSVLSNLKSARVEAVLAEEKMEWNDDYVLGLINLDGLLPWIKENKLQLAVFLSLIDRIEGRYNYLKQVAEHKD